MDEGSRLGDFFQHDNDATIIPTNQTTSIDDDYVSFSEQIPTSDSDMLSDELVGTLLITPSNRNLLQNLSSSGGGEAWRSL